MNSKYSFLSFLDINSVHLIGLKQWNAVRQSTIESPTHLVNLEGILNRLTPTCGRTNDCLKKG